MAYVCSPLARAENGEEAIPAVDLEAEFGSEARPLRCMRCHGYLSVSARWTDEGRVWACHLCGANNPTPAWYHCSLDGAGLRRDRQQRPELSRGSVDLLVRSEEYSTRAHEQLPVFVFAVDTSPLAVSSGLTLAAIEAVRAVLRVDLAEDLQAIVGVITFDQGVDFYSAASADPDAVRWFVCGGETPVAPLPPALWLLPVITGRSRLEAILDKILQLHLTSTQAGTRAVRLEQALTCVLEALENTGGRIVVVTSALPLPLAELASSPKPKV
jgi:protein transport protein SEC24